MTGKIFILASMEVGAAGIVPTARKGLRQLRMEIAREESVPPYIIFSDKTLLELCVRLPFNGEEMQKVVGIGGNKYARYKERFLGAINDFTGGKREKLYFGDEGEALPAALRGHHGGKPVGKTWYNML